MNRGIYTVDDDLISPYVKEARVEVEVEKVTRRLLDGSWHIQTIGEPSQRLNVKLSTYEGGKQTIDDIYGTGGLIKVASRDKVWTGYIDSVSWAYVFRGLYNGDMQVLVISEDEDA